MLTTPSEIRELVRSKDRGARVYSIDSRHYPSVTAIVQAGEPKPVLVNWAKKVTAEAAVQNRALVDNLIQQDGEQAAIDYLKGVGYRQRDAAGELGSKLHEVAEYEILEGKQYPDPGDPGASRLLSQFRDFIKVMRPEFHIVEGVVFNEEFGYAGTLDAIATLKPEGGDLRGFAGVPALLDWKSGSGVYGSHALQLSAYANSTHFLGPNGPEPMAGLFPERLPAAVVHITPQGWRLVEVDVGEIPFGAFLSCMQMAIWTKEASDQSVGRVLAQGKSNGGASMRLGKVAPAEVLAEFGSRRKIKPPTLSK